jgi:hypothetical protein
VPERASAPARENPVPLPQPALGTATIQFVHETDPSTSSVPTAPRPELWAEESRLLMMRRVKAMTLEQRLALFERLSSDAAWARSAKRIR